MWWSRGQYNGTLFTSIDYANVSNLIHWSDVVLYSTKADIGRRNFSEQYTTNRFHLTRCRGNTKQNIYFQWTRDNMLSNLRNMWNCWQKDFLILLTSSYRFEKFLRRASSCFIFLPSNFTSTNRLFWDCIVVLKPMV